MAQKVGAHQKRRYGEGNAVSIEQDSKPNTTVNRNPDGSAIKCVGAVLAAAWSFTRKSTWRESAPYVGRHLGLDAARGVTVLLRFPPIKCKESHHKNQLTTS
ncbi:hypothetical protein [Pararobbsia alpina]|uniref:Uncharacterized protein n=1 Tax=Pararobbsia alpina TaxID=621374 RepID=A0A6S7CVU6_9BURK|nr:hypothetical protein [Pararobbsia alpina]CAB3789428.1 hypothetical protein LMG28138_02769 [Pararobbsia alpina]